MDYISSVSSCANSDSSECSLVFNAHTESYEWCDSETAARNIKKRYITRDGGAVRELSDADIEKYPHYIRKCIRNGYSFKVTNKVTGAVKFVVAGCNSWRCPLCNRKVGAKDYMRLLAAFKARDINNAVALTITLNQGKEQTKGINAQKSYNVLTNKIKALIKSLRKQYGNIEYVYCVESHESGWGHANLTAFNKEMAYDARLDGDMISPPWLQNHIKKTKLGTVYSKIVYSYEGLAGYTIKTAYGDSLTGQISEMNKTSQLPIKAPKGFRRIKTSVRFWSKWEGKKKNDDVLCEFVRRGPTAQEMNEAIAAQKAQDSFLNETEDRQQLQPEGSTNVAGEASEAEKDAAKVIATIVPIRRAALMLTEQPRLGREGEKAKLQVGDCVQKNDVAGSCRGLEGVVLYLDAFRQRRLNL